MAGHSFFFSSENKHIFLPNSVVFFLLDLSSAPTTFFPLPEILLSRQFLFETRTYDESFWLLMVAVPSFVSNRLTLQSPLPNVKERRSPTPLPRIIATSSYNSVTVSRRLHSRFIECLFVSAFAKSMMRKRMIIRIDLVWLQSFSKTRPPPSMKIAVFVSRMRSSRRVLLLSPRLSPSDRLTPPVPCHLCRGHSPISFILTRFSFSNLGRLTRGHLTAYL